MLFNRQLRYYQYQINTMIELPSVIDMPQPMGNLKHLNSESLSFGAEELRVALLAGGKPASYVKCPNCLSSDVRRSTPATLREACMLLRSPFRCRKCLSRFYGNAKRFRVVTGRMRHVPFKGQGDMDLGVSI